MLINAVIGMGKIIQKSPKFIALSASSVLNLNELLM